MSAKDFIQLDLLSWGENQCELSPSINTTVSLPIVVSLSEVQTVMRDTICKEWRDCEHADICLDDDINLECACFKDEPEKMPATATPKCLNSACISHTPSDPTGCGTNPDGRDVTECTRYRGPARLVETVSVFSRDENKLLASGFPLVRYTRDKKLVELSEADPCNGWLPLDPFPTYAAAERKVKELKDKGHIETGLDGKIIMSGWNQPGGLLKAGFEFYRIYGHRSYDTDMGCCIKVGSKNWSNLAKYPGKDELLKAWDQLMKDPKALEG